MGATVLIERLACRYRVPREEPDPWGVRARLDRVLRAEVGERWSEALAPLVPEDEPGVIVIRRLDVKLLLGTGLPEDARLAAMWRRGVGTALARALSVEGDGRAVIRFPSHAAYLARFAEDVAAGRAWSQWFYAPFRELMSRPAGAVLREAFRYWPAAIVPALAHLEERDRLSWVTALLSDADAEAILAAVPTAAGDSARRTEATLVDTVAAGQRRHWWSDRPGVVALHLLAAAAITAGDEAPSPSLHEGVSRLALVLPEVRRLDAGAVSAGRALARLRRRDVHMREVVAPLLADHPAVARALLRAAGAPPTATAAPEDERTATPHGGVFLLVQGLAEMDLEGRLAEAGMGADAAWAAPLGRWLALLKCLGPEPRSVARVDPMLALAAGLEVVPNTTEVRRLARATRPLAAALGAALAAWCARARLTSGRDAVHEVARTPSRRRVTLERDGGNGLWLRTTFDADAPRDAGGPPGEGLPPAAAEVAHFHTTALTGDAVADLAWSHVAAVALHIFARRLPGFGLSSAGYLCRNFLAGTSLVERGAGGLSVDLPRAPLQVMLRVAGMTGRIEASWLPGGALSTDAGEE